MKAQPKNRKVFLYNMNTWFSNFVIDSLRTDIVPSPVANDFMGICGDLDYKLPDNFLPKIISIDSTFHYDHEVFTNDVFIFNLEDTKFEHIEYIIKGLKTLTHKTPKTLIIISSIMTWARSSPKIKKEPVEETGEAEAGEGEDGDEVKEKEEPVAEPEQEVSEDKEIVDELDEEEEKEKEEAGQVDEMEGAEIEKEPPVFVF
jgi:hypothetical protein